MATCGDDTTDSADPVDAVGGRIQQHCKPCCKYNRATPAKFFCQNCKEFQCIECSSHHKRFDFMTNHVIVDWQQVETGKHVVNMYGYDKCSEHGICVDIYCEDHDVLICARCAFADHKKCENAKHIHEFPLDKTIEEFKERLTACCDKAEEFINSVNKIGINEKDEVKAKAEKMKSEICEKIDTTLSAFLNEINTAADIAKSSMQHTVSHVSTIHNELEMWMKDLNTAYKQRVTDKSFILSKSLKPKVMKHDKYLGQQCLVDTSVSIKTEHMFNEKHDANVQVNSSDFLHQDEDANRSIVSRKLVAFKRNEISLVKKHLKNEEPVISGIDFLEDGRLVAIDNANKKCLVLGENLQVLGKPFTFFTNPLGICVYKESQAAVTSANQVYFLSVDEFNNIRLIRKVSTSSLYYSLSTFNCSMFICSAYRDAKAPVRVIDFDGKETDFKDILFPFINIGFSQSFSTYAKHLGILILTHFDSNKVYMFNIHTGEIITVDDKRIQGPKHVCMGPDDTVFVSCKRNSSICRITLEGQVLQTLEVEKLDLTALCISQDGTKFVMSGSSTCAQTIQLYELTDTLNT